MSTTYSKCNGNENIDTTESMGDLLKSYLKVLNAKQRDVDAIRQMHHEVWKESRVYPIIKQHRSGSRVEKQLRISQMGKQSDIDYTFEVTGVEINSSIADVQSTIYWKTSSISNAYGKIFVTKTYKEELQKMEYHSQIFTNDVFHFDERENNFLLIPKVFKENVVKMSGFDYRKDKSTETSVTSPSIPGQGAVNEYDVVPCLRMKTWPSIAEEWYERDNGSESCFNSKWRKEIAETVPLFVVPTGNPMSKERDQEFRLSFSQAEIKCFEKITARIRKYYGLGKYLFKTILGSDDVLASYHAKTILLWMAEEKSINDWKKMNPYEYVKEFFEKINKAIEGQTVRHFFLKDCNIFPKHKFNDEKMAKYKEKAAILRLEISSNIQQLLQYDLKIQGTTTGEIVSSGLKVLQEEMNNDAYLGGYLTRLLSVITFSLYENQLQETLEVATNRIRKVFHSYSEEKHIGRIIPMINATLTRMCVDGSSVSPLSLHECKMYNVDKISEKAHLAFEAYYHKEFETARIIITDCERCEYRSNGFGISITSYHKDKLDQQLNFIVSTLERESKNGKSPRFYVDPFLLIKHMRIQLDHMDRVNADMIPNHLIGLESIVEKLSLKEPYLGKLSYKFAGIYLLHGYKNFPLSDSLEINLTVPKKYGLGSLNQRMFAGNFDLR